MFIKKTKSIVYLVILLGTFLFLFVRLDFFVFLKFAVYNTTSIVIRLGSFPFYELKKIISYHSTYDKYLRLQGEALALKARLVGFEEVLRENNRLEKLLVFKRKLIFSSVAANVIGRDPSNWNSTIIIDKGVKDGIDIGMPVVNSLGVVGKIAEVNNDKAKVILLSDPLFSVAALDQRSREVGLVSGTLKGLCRMRYLSTEADVLIGDKIVTSKLSSSFPEGLVIGEVVDIFFHENNPMIDCLIEPYVSLSQIEEVLVVQTK